MQLNIYRDWKTGWTRIAIDIIFKEKRMSFGRSILFMIQITKNIEILDNLPDINPDFIDALSRRNLSLASLSKFQNFILKVKHAHKTVCS